MKLYLWALEWLMRWNMFWHWRRFDREIAAINREIDQIRLHHDEAVRRAQQRSNTCLLPRWGGHWPE